MSTAGATEVAVRRMRAVDVPGVAELLTLAFTEEFGVPPLDVAGTSRMLRAAALAQTGPLARAAALVAGEMAFFVAVRGGRVIGTTALSGRGLLTVNSVAVHPDFRRRGLAARLVGAAERHAAELGRETVVLDVLEHNRGARALYERLGYTEYHRFRAYGGDTSRALGSSLPAGYTLVRPDADARAVFPAIERAALPEGFRTVTPSLRARYLEGAPEMVERAVSGGATWRRALARNSRVAGFLYCRTAGRGSEAKIEYPLTRPEDADALAGALTAAMAWAVRGGAIGARLDISEERPDQHVAAERAGWVHRWSFVQMTHRVDGR